mmetsp:Transcript_5608/g.9113  ORF Transcript_5608/g.9113 Transcript_5608/m.9113 type:complete len:218 (-) Transcript_5608:31-684(-)
METGTKEDHLDGEERQLTRLRLASISACTDNVPSLEGVGDLVKGFGSASVVLERSHELQLSAIAANVIEHELALAADGVDSPGHCDELVLNLGAIFGFGVELHLEVGQSIVHVKFVRVGVPARRFYLLDLLFPIGLVLRWIQIFLIGGRGLFLGLLCILRRLGCCLFRLLLVCCLLLQQLLEGILGEWLAILIQSNFRHCCGDFFDASLVVRHGYRW